MKNTLKMATEQKEIVYLKKFLKSGNYQLANRFLTQRIELIQI